MQGKQPIAATVALLVLAGSPFALAQAKKQVSPADLADLKQVSDAQITPDGKSVAYVLTTPVAAGVHKDSHVWVVPTDKSQPAHPWAFAPGSADSHPRWSPDGKFLAFLSDRPNPVRLSDATSTYSFTLAGVEGRKDLDPREKSPTGKADIAPKDQLWLISSEGGEAVPLTNILGGVKDFHWSPDGKQIAFVRADQESKEEHERREARKEDHNFVDHDYKFDRLWVYDIARRQARLVTSQDLNIAAFNWSPDGSRFVVRTSLTPRINDYWRISKVQVIDAAKGTVLETLEEKSGAMEPRWSEDGKYIAFSARTQHGITNTHVLEELSTKKRATLEDKLKDITIGSITFLPSGTGLLETEQQTRSVSYVLTPASLALEPLPTGAPTHHGLTASKDGQTIAYVGNTETQPSEVWVVRGGHASAVTDTNPQVAGWNLGTQKQISWKSSVDGRTVYGVLLLPPGYVAGTKYKTAVHVHGGPEEGWEIGFHGSWYDYGTMLSSHGYVVLLPNPRGSDGQGPAYAEANYQDWGGGDFHDVMDGVDSLIKQGIADPERMVIGGWSYGGYMTSWTVTQTDRFKAAMVGAGVTDLFSMATTTDISPSFEDGYLGAFATNAKLYDERSAVRHLDNCHTPVLVLHGEADPRVPLSQGQEFYYGLRFREKEALMVTYPREPHIFSEREHQIDSHQRILDWYDAHVGAK